MPVSTVVFEPRPLPRRVAVQLRARLRDAHAEEPFSTVDSRATIRRVLGITEQLGVEATVYRGGLDLRGIEVDHVWIDVSGRVVDAAFPLFASNFVMALRDYVAGDAGTADLAAAAAGAGVDARVLGLFPRRMRYLGSPVWRSAS